MPRGTVSSSAPAGRGPCSTERDGPPAGRHVTARARSGETKCHWLADRAVGWGGEHVKIGTITRSERLAKYNRPPEIQEETGWRVV
jgi:enolase